LGWHAARYGIGMLAVSLGNFVIGGSLIFSAIIGAIGLPLFVYGMRNP
jgi:hypothetical protein